MPAPSRRSRSLRRVFVKTPGGRTVVHYKRKRHGPARCALCGAVLSGVPTGPKVIISNMSKTKKRPNRAYGGFLCPRCMREIAKEAVREAASAPRP